MDVFGTSTRDVKGHTHPVRTAATGSLSFNVILRGIGSTRPSSKKRAIESSRYGNARLNGTYRMRSRWCVVRFRAKEYGNPRPSAGGPDRFVRAQHGFPSLQTEREGC